MKRVLIFSNAYHPFIGGAEIAVKEITERTQDIRFDLITIRFDRSLPRFEKIGNVNVYRIGFTSKSPSIRSVIRFPYTLNNYFFPITAFFRAVTLHRRYKYDAIWAIMASYAGLAAMLFKTFHPKISFILTLQEGDSIDHIKKRAKFIHPFFIRIFTKADIAQAISKFLAKFAKDMGFRGNVEVIPNGVDSLRFSKESSKEESKFLAKKFGKRLQLENFDPNEPGGSSRESIGDIFLITTSRLVPKNGVIDIIKAMVLLPKYTKLIIIGGGPEMISSNPTSPDPKSLKYQVGALGLDDRVIFLGPLPHSEIPKYLKMSDIFIRPSLSEGFGNSFIESMAAGVPVIATPVGGIIDFIFDPDINPDKEPTGLFCEVQNPESIAKKVKILLENKELKDKIVKNAKKLAFEKYDWNLIASQMKTKIFDKVLKRV
ncbi:MAG: glycosyltransferase [Parcubacteria group bacterium]|nr:glycosyltransferase [Parcubacteria group bacterium]